jgi:hypothetical protein
MEPSDKFEATKFRVKKLYITTDSGDVDITGIFEELNIFDNLFLPCMSGNVLIRDSINLIENLKIDGNEEIVIELDKGDRVPEDFKFKKKFKLQKIKDKTNASHTTVIYVLHFVSEEFLTSQKSKVRKFYKDTYSNIARSVINEFFPNAKIDIITPSSAVYKVWPQTINPFDYLDWIARRAVGPTNKPDYFFYETQKGYNFESLSEIYNKRETWRISLGAKDLELRNEIKNEMTAARDFKLIKQFTLVDGVEQGIYGGTNIMFDPLTKEWRDPTYSFDTLYGGYFPNHANRYPNIPKDYKSGGFDKARITSHAFQVTRKTNEYILANDPETAQFTDNVEDYLFQRQHNVGILSQKRMLLTIAGNFLIKSGCMVYLEVPEFKGKESSTDQTQELDLDLTGKYVVVAVRHLIKYDKHETLLEVAADSDSSE